MPRRPVGMLSMTSLVTTFWTAALCTSTSGVSPVTVIVSASVADLHVGVDRRDERAGHLDAFALEGAESGQRERDCVGAWQQVDDLVLAGSVGDGRARLFNQRRAGRFHGHAGKHRARGVFDDTCHGRLRVYRCRGYYEQRQRDRREPHKSTHACLPSCHRIVTGKLHRVCSPALTTSQGKSRSRPAGRPTRSNQLDRARQSLRLIAFRSPYLPAPSHPVAPPLFHFEL